MQSVSCYEGTYIHYIRVITRYDTSSIEVRQADINTYQFDTFYRFSATMPAQFYFYLLTGYACDLVIEENDLEQYFLRDSLN